MSLGYWLLYQPLRFFYRLFYHRFTTRNRHLVPDKTPVIFLANHQNALMDALAILFGFDSAIVFLARADIFKNPTVARLLYFLKIMPIYRPRDGMENMAQNDAAFLRSVEVLDAYRPMAMFPEGVFNPHKNLFPLKKGFARIAFMAQQAGGEGFDLHIVPMGIDYNNKREPYSDVLVQYGAPIHIASLMDVYNENPPHAYHLLIQQVRERMLPLIINVEPTQYHETYMRIFDIYEQESLQDKTIENKHYRRFVWQQDKTEKLNRLSVEQPALMDSLQTDLDKYFSQLSEYGVDDKLLRKPRRNMFSLFFQNLLSLLLMVLYPIMMLVHVLPLLTARLVLPKIKDPQFISSIKFVTWFFTSLIYYPLITVLFCCFTENLWIKICFLPVLFLHGILLQIISPRIKMIRNYFRFFTLPKNVYNDLKVKRANIVKFISDRL